MQKLKLYVAGKIADALKSISPDVTADTKEISGMLEYPPDPSMGDLSFPCFKLSRALKKAPPQIASQLAGMLDGIENIDKIAPVGPYLNFFASSEYFSQNILNRILNERENYGRLDIGHGKTVVLDYSSPNVAKPFHIGHLGTTVIGHSLKMLHEFAGYKCIGINHLGDWGTQFGKLIVAYRKWGSKELIEEGGIDKLVELYVRFHKEAENDKSLEDEARAEFTKLEQGDEPNRELWKWFIEISIDEYKKTYKQLDIEFDYYTGESFYTSLMPPQVELMREKGLLKIDDGASIVDLTEYKMPPCLILKRDGSTLYPARDIAAAVYRKKTFDFDKCIYVTSSGQCLHFAQWFKVVELMGYDWYNELVHVPYGTVSINGTKLATRTGNVILLKDLFKLAEEKVRAIMDVKNPELEDKDKVSEAVGVEAIVFYYLSNSRIKDIDFNINEALSFDGNTGPYAQYTYARCCTLIEKAGGVPLPDRSRYIPQSCEVTLLKTLARFSENVESALADYEPMQITRYILNVCNDFNRFYNECPINTADDEPARRFRLRLTEAVRTVLGNAFPLICLKKTPKI